MKKKFLILVSCIFVSSLFCENVKALEVINGDIYVNSNGVVMSESQIENLENLGFSDKQIELMDQEEFNNNKDLNGEIVAETIKYYKTTTITTDGTSAYSLNGTTTTFSEEITEEEYNNSENTISPNGLENGDVETEYKKMTSTIIAVNGRYRLKNTVNWKKAPKIRSYDIIGIGIDSTVSGVPSTKYFKRIADIDAWDTCYFDSSTTGTWTQKSTGYAVTFKLPSDGEKYYVQAMEIYMYFEVAKLQTTTITTLNAYGDYKHAIVGVDASISASVGINSNGIGLSASLAKKFDSIPTAQAQWTGLSW